MLSRGLRPFILRRTKEQVASDLPPRTEQTLYCELERPQRTLYDELRAHYRRTLLKGTQTDGFGRAKLQVLEALLRLRQAACHPGLIDRAPDERASAQARRAGAAPRRGRSRRVTRRSCSRSSRACWRFCGRASTPNGIPYEYLDGRTRDRQARVERFQNDPDCRLFLISLKAGGLGLNLTAAEYVFLLDPWWNPAVEAQAIDRAHRIGQERHVFAYRLIARDTVEERVLELQQRKRRLADAILTADNSLIRDLSGRIWSCCFRERIQRSSVRAESGHGPLNAAVRRDAMSGAGSADPLIKCRDDVLRRAALEPAYRSSEDQEVIHRPVGQSWLTIRRSGRHRRPPGGAGSDRETNQRVEVGSSPDPTPARHAALRRPPNCGPVPHSSCSLYLLFNFGAPLFLRSSVVIPFPPSPPSPPSSHQGVTTW